ncbi:hypothetical protein [Natribacillus halophilus]|uniref:Ribbon-helix-helix protein, copG family n=1 Tax=Natribacillus halophilus TaxID=549003 RepID=A0A1G8KJ42_9BACI|nr:hypothetical protein [Natribacillus halophilus]SDI43386.1 hypothetical protein SAMN04488123_102133 [Natribacillus halophilus]
MEVRIRYMEPWVVKKIDELAKQKQMTRQEFLHAQLTQMAIFHQEDERVQRLEELVASNLHVMERCATSMQTMNALIGDETEPSS